LDEFGARLSSLYLSITGVVWIVAGLVLLWALFSGKMWARLAIPLAILLWITEYWVERLFFESARANFFFALIASMILLVVTFISAFHERTRRFFIRSEDHEQSNKYSGAT